MSYWKKFYKAIEHWPLSISAQILAEAKIAAVAYDLGARRVVGIGMTMAMEEVAKMLLDESNDSGILHDEVDYGEFGAYEPRAIESISETPLLYLYSADVDDRDQYWSGLVFSLLFDSGVGSLTECSATADRALIKARRDMLPGGRI